MYVLHSSACGKVTQYTYYVSLIVQVRESGEIKLNDLHSKPVSPHRSQLRRRFFTLLVRISPYPVSTKGTNGTGFIQKGRS